ncbi:tRNA pseudouridine38-40 synthase [Thermodesulfovibrio aggregans]|uniref:tRNA pseudouridine synthase A n=1 Tax=Thermodesulfovibrio aggregans TaxID=86166 RepID=A0A0U9HWA1_9BACT|nr:tRNA pseudouridine(38-40) synthase TruA [Thermodesulfovibrio aggregans]GAQ95217.1 tRNA pseudouridine38-40 synthase [Thermodesulfovibrio aggregans]
MAHIKMIIQYDGTNYFGWQSQKKGQTIQGKIEEILYKILKKPIKIRGAGRTDAGVHALAQVASFKADLKISLSVLKKVLNSLLPKDIRIINLEEVDDHFHPQYSVKRKSYIYYLCIDEECSCFIQRYVWHYPRKLNLDLIDEALSLFKGTKDFTAFSGSTDVKNRVRTVYDFTMQKLDSLSFMDMQINGSFIKFRIEADGFLRYMVRNIVGCIVEVGREKLSIDAIRKAFNSGERPSSMQTAPPHGLFLEEIYY